MKRHVCACLCALVTNVLNRQQKPISGKTMEKENKVKNPKNDEKLSETSLETKKSTKKVDIIRIPKNGCTVPFLITLFTNLTTAGVILQNNTEIMRAVNITLAAKDDLEEGKQWNGHIEIAENLKLKLYKTGLVLWHKK